MPRPAYRPGSRSGFTRTGFGTPHAAELACEGTPMNHTTDDRCQTVRRHAHECKAGWRRGRLTLDLPSRRRFTPPSKPLRRQPGRRQGKSVARSASWGPILHPENRGLAPDADLHSTGNANDRCQSPESRLHWASRATLTPKSPAAMLRPPYILLSHICFAPVMRLLLVVVITWLGASIWISTKPATGKLVPLQ